MTNLHCPLCGLWFHYGTELDQHAREDHAPPAHLNCPPPRARRNRFEPPVQEQEQDQDQEPALHPPG